jgi:hypothetical protein
MRKLIDWIKSYTTYPDPEISWALVIGLILAGIALVFLLTGCQPERHSPYLGHWVSVEKSGISLPESLNFEQYGTGYYHYSDSTTRTDFAAPITWGQCAAGIWVHGNNGSWVYNATFAHDTLCLNYVKSSAKYVRQ